jgi:hypothetical protein
MSKYTVESLIMTTFPRCLKLCSFVKIIGVHQCESTCPWKFDSAKLPVGIEILKKNIKNYTVVPPTVGHICFFCNPAQDQTTENPRCTDFCIRCGRHSEGIKRLL